MIGFSFLFSLITRGVSQSQYVPLVLPLTHSKSSRVYRNILGQLGQVGHALYFNGLSVPVGLICPTSYWDTHQNTGTEIKPVR